MTLTTLLVFVVFGSATTFAQQAPPPVEGKNLSALRWKPRMFASSRPAMCKKKWKSCGGCWMIVSTPSMGIPGTATWTWGVGLDYYPLIGPGQLAFSPDGAKLGSCIRQPPVAHPVEGVYLKDYGVVYTVTLPTPPNGMTPGPTAGTVTRTPLSPWERTRKELRGEKIENEGKVVGTRSPSLSEVILKVLADNGKHFTRLAEGERITVVVTFRDDAANGIFHPQSPGGSGGFSMPGMAGGIMHPGPDGGFVLGDAAVCPAWGNGRRNPTQQGLICYKAAVLRGGSGVADRRPKRYPVRGSSSQAKQGSGGERRLPGRGV